MNERKKQDDRRSGELAELADVISFAMLVTVSLSVAINFALVAAKSDGRIHLKLADKHGKSYPLVWTAHEMEAAALLGTAGRSSTIRAGIYLKAAAVWSLLAVENPDKTQKYRRRQWQDIRLASHLIAAFPRGKGLANLLRLSPKRSYTVLPRRKMQPH